MIIEVIEVAGFWQIRFAAATAEPSSQWGVSSTSDGLAIVSALWGSSPGDRWATPVEVD